MNSLDLANAAAGVAGAAAGTVIAAGQGLAGSAFGAIVGSLLADGLKDFAGRALSNRERIRVDLAATYIQDAIQRKLDKGQQIRDDGFLGPSPSSAAAELFEGILLKCKAQYEQKKLQHIAKLYANTLFNSEVQARTAYQILYFVENITYQNLCVIAFYGRRQEFSSLDLLASHFSDYAPKMLGEQVLSAARDLFFLIQQGVLKQDGSFFAEHTAITAAKVTLAPFGQHIFNLLELQYVLTEDVKLAAKPFEYQDAWGLDREGKRNGRPL
jgi:hypothetical protein